MTFARVEPPSAPKVYEKGALLQITSSGIEIGQTMKWWLKVAVATGENQVWRSSHKTTIQAIDPDTGELVKHLWRTECLQALPPGEEAEAVLQLLKAIDVSERIAGSPDSETIEPVEADREGELVVLPTANIQLLEELSYEEEKTRLHLERKVERAFYEAGSALRQLRDQRLYRSTHKTFEAYCQDRFGFSRAHSYRLIDAAEVVDNLSPNWRQILPTRESQVRAIVSASLQPAEQAEVWQEAVEKAGGKAPPARIVKGIVDRIKAKSPSPAKDFCFVGDVFLLTKLVESERKYNSCWAVAVETREFTVVVDVHDQRLIVKPENLEPLDFPQAQRQLPTILKRIRQLRSCGLLDRGAYTLLDSFGKQTYLTELEEGLLSYLENHYGINDEKSS